MRDSQALLPPAQSPVKRVFVASELLAPEQAIVAFFARARLAPPRVETVALEDAWSRILATDVAAREDHPSHARSTMDGFAIATAHGNAARRIVGEVKMGFPPPRAIAADEALRVPTGGALPPGADAVVPVEDVVEHDGTIELREPVEAGEFFTRAASDMHAGERALEAGRRIGAPELGVLATLGVTQVPVFRRPCFAIVSTGDELVDANTTPAIGQVRDSNRYAVAGALRAMGCDAEHFPRVSDEPDALRAVLRDALARCDAVVLTGGSSVGARDIVPRIVAQLGEPGVIVHGIRLKPGKPTMFADIGGKPVIGLPGNPTSSLMVLEAVARPIVAACTGERAHVVTTLEAIATAPFVGRDGWTWYVPARLEADGGRLCATPLRLHSAHVSLLARASGYVVVGEQPSRFETGEVVRVVRFTSGGAPVESAPSRVPA